MSKKRNDEVINPFLIDNQPIIPFYNLPTSREATFLQDILGGGKTGRIYKVTTHQKEGENWRIYERKAENGTLVIKVPDFNALMENNTAAAKILNYILIIINKHYKRFNTDGTLKNPVIHFPLQDLIDGGMYADRRAARRGFKSAIETLLNFEFPMYYCSADKRNEGGTKLRFIKTWHRKDGDIFVYISEDFIATSLFESFAPLPKYYLGLKTKASQLLSFISNLSRMRIQDIEKQGFFVVTLKTLQDKLNLPPLEGNRRPEQTIRTPIEKALEEIEQAEHEQEQAQPGSQQYQFEVVAEETSTKQWLNGYVKVYIRGIARQNLINFEHKKERVIKASISKWEKRKQAREVVEKQDK